MNIPMKLPFIKTLPLRKSLAFRATLKRLLGKWRDLPRTAMGYCLFGFPIVMGIVGLVAEASLFSTTGLSGRYVLFGIVYILIACAMSFFSGALENLARQPRLRPSPDPEAALNVIDSQQVLTCEIERLVESHVKIQILDVGGLSRHLVETQTFPVPRSGSIQGYEQISIVNSREQLESVLELALRGSNAPGVSHFCLSGDIWILPSFSFAVFEHKDGLHGLVFRETCSGHLEAVEVYDDRFTRFLRSEFIRYWNHLSADGESLLVQGGRFREKPAEHLAKACGMKNDIRP